MPVYLIQAGENGPVKIGKADKPRARLIELQVAHYARLKLLRMWYGHEAEEAALHLRFADLHIRGEWYGFSRHMLGDVGLIEFIEPAPAKPLANEPLTAGQIISALGGATSLSRIIPAGRSAISNWPKDGIPARFWPSLSRLASQTKGAEHITLDELERHTAPARAEAA